MINEEKPRSKKEASKELKELKSTLAELRIKQVETLLASDPHRPVLRYQSKKIPKKGEK